MSRCRTSKGALLIALFALAGCGGAQTPSVANSMLPPMATADSASNDPWLYVSGLNDVVNVYDVAQRHSPLVLSITQGISKPAGLKVDSNGTLYVTNTGSNTITEYPLDQTEPSVTLSVTSPQDIALDPRTGDLYVDTRTSPPGIFIFKKGHTQPSRYVLSKLLVLPAQMLFDSVGTLYVADNQSGVVVIRAGTRRVASLGLQNLDGCASGIALDEHTNELYVSDCDSGIQVYKRGRAYPIRSLNSKVFADYLAIGVVGNADDLFAPDVTSDTVTVYHANRNNPFKVVTTASQNALGVAVKPAGTSKAHTTGRVGSTAIGFSSN